MTYRNKKRLVKARNVMNIILVLITFPFWLPYLLIRIAMEQDNSTQYNAMTWNDNNLMY